MLKEILIILFLLFLVWYGGKYFGYHIPYLSDINIPIPHISFADIFLTKVVVSPSPGAVVTATSGSSALASPVVSMSPNQLTTVVYASTGAIQDLLAKKYQKDPSMVAVNVSLETGQYASGTVRFGADGSGGSGVFLAAKGGEKWTLVYDGNGIVPCAAIDQYDFPRNMVPQCVGNKGKMVDRTLDIPVKIAPQ